MREQEIECAQTKRVGTCQKWKQVDGDRKFLSENTAFGLVSLANRILYILTSIVSIRIQSNPINIW